MPAILHKRSCWLPGIALLIAAQAAPSAEEPAAKEVEKTAFLNIRVVDEKGQPQTDSVIHLILRRNEVRLLGGKQGEPFHTLKCNEQGWATIGPFEPGEGYYAYASVQKERYTGRGSVLDKLTLKAGRNEHVVVYTTPVGSSVSGVLVDKAGRPLDGITVRLAPRNWCGDRKQIPSCGPMRIKPTCTTDTRGEFSFEGLKSAENWAVIAVCGLDILFLGPPIQIPPGGRLDVGRITTDIDRKDVKVGPD